MMKYSTIRGLLKGIKKDAIAKHIIKDMDNDQGLLDRPTINKDLNDMVEGIYRVLLELLNKDKISQIEFDNLWDYTQDYCSQIQI